jgi:hypothetical protein
VEELRVKSGIKDPDQRPVGPFSVKDVLSESGSLSAIRLPLIIVLDPCD